MQKWLKDRKGRTLAFDDLEHYAKVVSALSQTIKLMNAIDETIEENGGFPIQKESAYDVIINGEKTDKEQVNDYEYFKRIVGKARRK